MSLLASVTVARHRLALDVGLDVEGGTTVAVVGPNGAGKSTLLHALAGLVRLDGGRVVVGERTWEDAASGVRLAPEQRSVGVAFQDQLLFPHLNVLDNVAFGPRRRGAARDQARRVAAGWLERLGIGDLARSRPGALSGGQAQRVALARALAVEAELLLLDEPLAALDASIRPSVRRDLRDHLAAAPGVRLVVTHDPVDAMVLASRIVVVEGGRVVQDAAPADLGSRPRSRYVAEMVGVNLLRGTARAGVVDLDGGGAVRAASAPDGPVLAVVHPRAVSMHRTRPAGTPRNVWDGVVASIDDEGERVRVRVDGCPSIVAEVTPAAAAELGLAPGSPVWVAVKATEVDVYPA